MFPEDQRAQLPAAFQADGTFEEGETKCTIDGEEKDAELKVIVWNNFTDTDDGTTYVADFDNIRVDQDAMVFSIAFVPPDTAVGMPPWAQNLPELGAADTDRRCRPPHAPERPSPARRPRGPWRRPPRSPSATVTDATATTAGQRRPAATTPATTGG